MKLNIAQAKSTGWEARLNSVTQERDDLQQELDSERQRAKNAEASVASLKERCGMYHSLLFFVSTTNWVLDKFQSENACLYDEIHQQKQSRTELSEEILRDARARLEMAQQQVCS